LQSIKSFIPYMNKYNFASRHNGPDEQEITHMLEAIGSASIESLIAETIPASIRLHSPLDLPDEISEHKLLKELAVVASKNKVFKSYIGLGYYNTITPGVIQRNVFESPGWYTAYTPYQAEIAQGRLEALLNFQTVIADLTGLPIANASLLDEATAAAEAMHMMYSSRSKEAEAAGANKFFVSKECFPQTIAVLKTRSVPVGIELVIGDHLNTKIDKSFFGVLLQYPAADGQVYDYAPLVKTVKEMDVQVAVAADILSLTLLTPPGEWGADVVVGSTQRLGVPMGYGGPHAAYFATREEYKRDIPGRIIGVSVDRYGNRALRMALQTREQHIKRDKATSNICTSQVLLAVIAGMYCVYHGPAGLRHIAYHIHKNTKLLAQNLVELGYEQMNEIYFDTIKIKPGHDLEIIKSRALAEGMNFRYNEDHTICISLDETVDKEDIENIISVFASAKNLDPAKIVLQTEEELTEELIIHQYCRTSPFLTHEVFNIHHSETEMLRYISKLENRDLALNFSMIPLGSCTMKLNATAEMIPLSWTGFSAIHPFAPVDQAVGYGQIIAELEKYLCSITGLDAVSLQPNSGAQGEYSGLMVIRQYHHSRGDEQRNVVLIPSSAHGTNPASAVMAGMKVVVVKCDANGNIDLEDLKAKADVHKERLAALMVTYPSTHGVFEENIKDIISYVHNCGGQVYMDGANMNAQVGLTNPAMIGADVCHLNLHKTFAIPHGGGGPGMGPIAVAAHLAPFLPGHPVIGTGGTEAIDPVSAAPWGSSSILIISYAYIRLMGKHGLKRATEIAILNANYIKCRLEEHYPVLYKGRKGRIAHEMILDCRHFKNSAQVDVMDIAKRLIDYGYHAPTVSFPVPGTLMVEPTESEALSELDRFCDAMIAIREEIREVENGIADKTDNVLRNSPHTVTEVTADDWNHGYSRQKAAFPLNWQDHKFWPCVGRVDNAYGDRNLICTCPPLENYEEEMV
jgi:glycine dehydrogenase